MIGVEDDPGIEQLIKDLNALGDELERKAIRSGLVAAAKPLKSELKDTAQKQSGRLQKSVGHRVLSKTASSRIKMKRGQQAILVGPNRKVGGMSRSHIAQLLEDGTKPHIIKPRKGNKTLRLQGGQLVKKIRHPGVKATHWMQNAHSSTQTKVNDLFYQGLSKHLDKQKSKS